jgi:hypothetical protein
MKKPKKVEIAEQDRVDVLDDEVNAILGILDMDGSLVTDESYLRDFMCIFSEPEEIECHLNNLQDEFGVEIESEYEKVVDVAQRIRDAKKEQASKT